VLPNRDIPGMLGGVAKMADHAAGSLTLRLEPKAALALLATRNAAVGDKTPPCEITCQLSDAAKRLDKGRIFGADVNNTTHYGNPAGLSRQSKAARKKQRGAPGIGIDWPGSDEVYLQQSLVG
jgi:hypothetical protein